MADPATGSPPWNWWRASDDRRRVTIEVARVAGKQMLEEEQSAATVRCWTAALESAKYIEGPPPPTPPGAPQVGSTVTLRMDLALLYFQNRALDPNGEKLDNLVRELFLGKLEAYKSQRSPEIQQYHTVIGLIYATRRVWNPAPGGWPPAGAIYQLTHALETADLRRKEEHFYQPLPELKARLAEGYETTGDIRTAQQTYFLAALAYLDSDSPYDSARMLASYRRLGGTSNDAEKLETLINYRRQPVLSTALSDPNLPLLIHGSGTLDADFLVRQRFKVCADQAIAGDSSVSASQRLALAWEAYKLVAEQGTLLVGSGDLVRWTNITARLLEVGQTPPQPLRLLRGSELVTSHTPAPRLAIDGQTDPIAISVSPETQSAAEIVAALGPENALTLGKYIQLRANQVFVENDNVPSNVDIMLRDLLRDRALQVYSVVDKPIA